MNMNSEENSEIEGKIKKTGKKSAFLGIIIAFLVGSTVLAGVLYFTNGEKIDLAKAFSNTSKKQSKELEEIVANNEVFKNLEKIFDESYEMDLSFTQFGVDTMNINFAKDNKSEIFYLGGAFNNLITGGLYVTNDKNYLEFLNSFYSFDTENSLYGIANWLVEGEALPQEELEAIEMLNGVDLSYDMLNEYNSYNSKETSKEIENIMIDLFKSANIEVAEATLFVDGEDKTVSQYTLPIDLEEYMRKVYEVQAEYAEENSIISLTSTDEQLDLMFEDMTYGDSFIEVYQYDDYIVKLGIKSSIIDKIYGTEIPFEVHFASKSTKEMLNDFEIDVLVDKETFKLVFENDLFNKDKMEINATVFSALSYDEETLKLNFVWDYTTNSDNCKLSIEEDSMSEPLTTITTIAIIDDVITYEYDDDDNDVFIGLTLKELSENIALPTADVNLYDMTFEEFLMSAITSIYGTMY